MVSQLPSSIQLIPAEVSMGDGPGHSLGWWSCRCLGSASPLICTVANSCGNCHELHLGTGAIPCIHPFFSIKASLPPPSESLLFTIKDCHLIRTLMNIKSCTFTHNSPHPEPSGRESKERTIKFYNCCF